jgi:hypothetical protein
MKIIKTIKTSIFSILLGGIILSLGSCYPENNLTTAELDTVFSFYDDNANFSNYKTYSLPDSVVVLDQLSNQNGTGKFDDEILVRVKSNLDALGYEEEADPTNNVPDVLVLVSKAINTNVEAYTYYNWWDYYGWYPYWGAYPYSYGAGWSPYYSWSGTVVYSYRTGTLFIEMVDVSASNEANKEIPTVWAGAINGLVEGTDAEISARLDTRIDQAFAQSPYLKTN